VEECVLFVLLYESENRRWLLQRDLEVQTQILNAYTMMMNNSVRGGQLMEINKDQYSKIYKLIRQEKIKQT
jgi:hypothetical protein